MGGCNDEGISWAPRYESPGCCQAAKRSKDHWSRPHEDVLGIEIEQSNRSIKLHLDHYVSEMLNEYKAYTCNQIHQEIAATQACSDLT